MDSYISCMGLVVEIGFRVQSGVLCSGVALSLAPLSLFHLVEPVNEASILVHCSGVM